ncbi:MAG: sulfurtransferase complex subunit TusB [Thermoleophilia bacterium]
MINKSPFESMSLDDCLKYASKGSAIILYEDGIYAAMAGTALESKMNSIAGDYKVYVLKEDLMQRGIDKLISGVTEVDYAGFVDLVEEHKTCSW